MAVSLRPPSLAIFTSTAKRGVFDELGARNAAVRNTSNITQVHRATGEADA